MLSIRYVPASQKTTLHSYFIEPCEEIVQALWDELFEQGKFGVIILSEADLLHGGSLNATGSMVLYAESIAHWPPVKKPDALPAKTEELLAEEKQHIEAGENYSFLMRVRDRLKGQ